MTIVLRLLLTCIIVLLVGFVSSDAVDWHTVVFGRHILTKVWEHGMEYDFDELYGCLNQSRHDVDVFHADEVWRFLRYTYKRVVKGGAFLVQGGGHEQHHAAIDSGFQVSTRVIQNKRGIGVVAAEPIEAESMVVLPTYSADFLNPAEFRRFLQALPPYLVCDVLEWAYIRLDEKEEARICLDVDTTSNIQVAGADEEPNLIPAWGFGRFSGCELELVAIRDIAEGEELLMDGNFAEGQVGWVWIGMNDQGNLSSNEVQEYWENVAEWHGYDDEDEDDHEL